MSFFLKLNTTQLNIQMVVNYLIIKEIFLIGKIKM